ncbi:MAG: hypothetical protein WA708_19305 [Acidobacteriaceae bacterium]|jgi:hypothetical protein
MNSRTSDDHNKGCNKIVHYKFLDVSHSLRVSHSIQPLHEHPRPIPSIRELRSQAGPDNDRTKGVNPHDEPVTLHFVEFKTKLIDDRICEVCSDYSLNSPIFIAKMADVDLEGTSQIEGEFDAS